MQRQRVEHNTIVQGESDLAGAMLAFNNADPSPATLIMRNNIFYVTGSQMISHKSAIVHDHNLYYLTHDKSYVGFDLGQGEILADPLFVDGGAANFHLRAGSPAIDAGANLGYGRDLDGVSVPAGSAPDLGAYEFASPTTVPTDTPGAMPTQTKPAAAPTQTEPIPTATQPASTPTNTHPTPTPPREYRVALPILLRQWR